MGSILPAGRPRVAPSGTKTTSIAPADGRLDAARIDGRRCPRHGSDPAAGLRPRNPQPPQPRVGYLAAAV